MTTELGGVLFLVNVIRRLELPDVCEPGWGLASDVGGWGIVELLGRILVGSDPPDAYADPIWAVLAELAGRPPGTLPGPARPGPDVFVLPPIWTRDVPDGNDQRWAWAGRRGLVRVWSDRGYVVGEEIGGGAASRGRARRLLSLHAGRGAHDLTRSALRAAPVVPTDVPLLAGLDAHLARWLGIVTPFVRWRLTRAFRPAGAPAGDLDAPLLRRRAQLHVTATHVDMVLGLDDATVPVRVAGLDLDPGWVPELGRVVRFLYE